MEKNKQSTHNKSKSVIETKRYKIRAFDHVKRQSFIKTEPLDWKLDGKRTREKLKQIIRIFTPLFKLKQSVKRQLPTYSQSKAAVPDRKEFTHRL